MTAPSAVLDIYEAAYRTRWTREPLSGLDYLTRRQVLIITDLLHRILHECNLDEVTIPSLDALHRAFDGVGFVVEEHKDRYKQGIYIRKCLETLRPLSGNTITQHALLDVLPTFH